jgi:HSP20 family protein
LADEPRKEITRREEEWPWSFGHLWEELMEPWWLPQRRRFRRGLMPAAAGLAWTPDVDVFERDGRLVVRADLPGVKREDVDVHVEDGVLVIRGSRKEEHEVKEEGYHRMERVQGSFARRIQLPDGVRPADVAASFKDGVLEVVVPRPAGAKPNRVHIDVKEED